jgi:hypothetical protein
VRRSLSCASAAVGEQCRRGGTGTSFWLFARETTATNTRYVVGANGRTNLSRPSYLC